MFPLGTNHCIASIFQIFFSAMEAAAARSLLVDTTSLDPAEKLKSVCLTTLQTK
jgi:hypothetical protein